MSASGIWMNRSKHTHISIQRDHQPPKLTPTPTHQWKWCTHKVSMYWCMHSVRGNYNNNNSIIIRLIAYMYIWVRWMDLSCWLLTDEYFSQPVTLSVSVSSSLSFTYYFYVGVFEFEQSSTFGGLRQLGEMSLDSFLSLTLLVFSHFHSGPDWILRLVTQKL